MSNAGKTILIYFIVFFLMFFSVFMEEYDFTNVNTTYTKEVGMNDYFESMNKEDNE